MYQITLLVGFFSAALAARDSLTISEYNQVMDKTIEAVSEPSLAKLPIALPNYQHQLFAPIKPSDPSSPSFPYRPPRYNVILSDVTLKRVGSIKREGNCVILNPNKTWEADCVYTVKDYNFGAKGKNGEEFNERPTFMIVASTYQGKTPDKKGNMWDEWCPWAPVSGLHKPTYEDTLSAEIKAYLGKVDTTSINWFKDYIISTFEFVFLNYDNLTLKFNNVLKELKLDYSGKLKICAFPA